MLEEDYRWRCQREKMAMETGDEDMGSRGGSLSAGSKHPPSRG